MKSAFSTITWPAASASFSGYLLPDTESFVLLFLSLQLTLPLLSAVSLHLPLPLLSVTSKKSFKHKTFYKPPLQLITSCLNMWKKLKWGRNLKLELWVFVCAVRINSQSDESSRIMATTQLTLWTKEVTGCDVWFQNKSLLTSFCCLSSSFILISRASALAARFAASLASAWITDQCYYWLSIIKHHPHT